MKISIITISFNSSRTIRRAIESVINQKNVDIEYLLIDGNSTDGTFDIIKDYAERYSFIRTISEADKGIYDAMNKGLTMSTGDIVGILNSDDLYAADNILEKVVFEFQNAPELESCYGNLLYVKTKAEKLYPYRYWFSGKPRTFKFGWMPPHPAFFVRKDVYNRYGTFRLDCGTSADYELMLRFLEKYKITTKWINKLFTYMELGGASNSNLLAYKKASVNDISAWGKNELKTPIGVAFLKRFRKLPQFLYAKFVKI